MSVNMSVGNKIFVLFMMTVFLSCFSVYGQEELLKASKTKKGGFYFYWGYNRTAYTKSNLRLVGEGYDFTMKNLRAHDSPERFKPSVYFNPKKITIPQFNVRFGYFFKDNWSLSLGYDHMKYIMNNYQLVNLYGHIDEGVSDQWSGDYRGEVMVTSDKFIHYENSDGLNYMRLELSRYQQLVSLGENNWLRVNAHLGVSSGFILSFNDFNFGNQFDRRTVSVSGYGISLSGGFRFDFFNRFFLQTNVVGGMIHQTKVKTRPNDDYSHAKQIFGFAASETVLGFAWKF
jgi:hypothetical protein